VQTFNPYQYADLQDRSADLYASTKYDILLHWLSGKRGLRILNAGCGSGDLSFRLASAGHSVVGIDPEPAYIDLARANAAARPGLDCSFTVCSIEDYTAEAAFDCVIATDVLEHIADDRAAFAALAALTRPGGLILITVPAGQWLFGYHDEQIGHYRRYSRSSLAALAREFCRVEQTRYFGFSMIPVCYLYSRVLRKAYPVAQSGDPRRKPFRAWVLRTLLKLDRRLPLPTGTSVLMRAVKT
jgi:SAM-dependent methyltransferase